MFDWNDLRYLIAVADGGSTSAAARNLRVSQTTVARRIAALEEALGVALVDRKQAGYDLTQTGQELINRAREVAEAAAQFELAAASRSRDARSAVTLTTEEIYANTILAPILRELAVQHPDIRIQLDTTLDVRDLGGGEADIALRSMDGTAAPGLVGRRICTDDWTFYCSKAYSDTNGVPRTPDEMRGHPVIGGGGGSLWRAYSAWLREFGLEDNVAIHHASSTGVFTAVQSGAGIAVLPLLIAENDPQFVRCLRPFRGNRRALWLLTHERLRHNAAVRTVIDFLYDQLKQRAVAARLND